MSERKGLRDSRFYFFAGRNFKEISRDSLTVSLGLILPLFLLALFSFIESNVSGEADILKPINLAPGIIVFGFSFLFMFSSMLIATDRKSSFLPRLFASPLKPSDYIAGYSLPMVPIAMAQAFLVFLVSWMLGVHFSANMVLAFFLLLPMGVFTVFLGMLLGSLLSETQIQGMGTILITFVTLMSGAWMELDILGNTLESFCYVLPFANAVEMGREVLKGDFSNILPRLLIVCAWTVGVFILACYSFRRRMSEDQA